MFAGDYRRASGGAEYSLKELLPGRGLEMETLMGSVIISNSGEIRPGQAKGEAEDVKEKIEIQRQESESKQRHKTQASLGVAAVQIGYQPPPSQGRALAAGVPGHLRR